MIHPECKNVPRRDSHLESEKKKMVQFALSENYWKSDCAQIPVNTRRSATAPINRIIPASRAIAGVARQNKTEGNNERTWEGQKFARREKRLSRIRHVTIRTADVMPLREVARNSVQFPPVHRHGSYRAHETTPN